MALEVRPGVTGFVVMEDQKRLVDWGIRKHRVQNGPLENVVPRKVRKLLRIYSPSIVVVRARDVRSRKARRRIDEVIHVVRREARRRAIRFRGVGTKFIRSVFESYHCATKQETAILIAGWFPELSSKLPARRKTWKSEDSRMVLFDAAATALAFQSKSQLETTSGID